MGRSLINLSASEKVLSKVYQSSIALTIREWLAFFSRTNSPRCSSVRKRKKSGRWLFSTRISFVSHMYVYTYHVCISYISIHVSCLYLIYTYTRVSFIYTYACITFKFHIYVYTNLVYIFITSWTHTPYYSFFMQIFQFLLFYQIISNFPQPCPRVYDARRIYVYIHVCKSARVQLVLNKIHATLDAGEKGRSRERAAAPRQIPVT